ncbi:T9SS type A sorting domain-containing protein [Corallibacter sp.]|uniref:T9SS type A sorting domain-containing protein n=1 Tax=Corallibacter sp. TaxID=2038084 RepID=UPI003AB3A8E9
MKKKLLTILLFIISILTIQSQSDSTTFSPIITIDASPGSTPYAIASGNLDGDSFPDLVVGLLYGNKVLHYKNNGNGTFASAVEVSSLTQVSGLFLADIDGINGDDILATSFDGNKLVWYANDGSGNFGSENVISNNINGAGAVYAANIDDNIGLDVIVAGFNDNKFVWFSNDGSGNFGTEQTIASGLSGAGDFDIKDFDGDNDLDIVISTAPYTPPGVIEVFYNQLTESGSPTFIIDSNNVSNSGQYLFDVNFADIDNDGSIDILATDSYSDLAWYKKEGDGSYTKIVIPVSLPSSAIVESVDLDNDGDNDLVVSNGSATGTNDIVWFESDGTSPTTFETEGTVDGSGTQSQVFSMTINDFDNDGDLDIASAGYNSAGDGVYWIKNQLESLSINEELKNKGVSIYPNPAKNVLHIKTNLSNIGVATVYNILGKKVLNTHLSENKSIDISKLSHGIYILKFSNSDKAFKFIKE